MSEGVGDLPSVLASLRLGRVPTLSDCGLRPDSGAILWPRLCVPCAPWSAVPEPSERQCCELLPAMTNKERVHEG